MAEGRDVLRGIAWRELFPWLIIFRTFRVATNPSILFVATLAGLLTPVGWHVFAGLLSDEPAPQVAAAAERLQEHAWEVPGANWEAAAPDVVMNYTLHAPRRGVQPLVASLFYPVTTGETFYFLLGGLWTLVIWAFAGGIITRIAVVRLGREERIGLVEAFQHVISRLAGYAGAPVFPFVGFLLALIVAVPLGWLMRLDVGLLLVSVIWPIAILVGLTLAVLLIGLVFGWPFMWVAVSAEEIGDVFEAVQRGYSYTWERPLNYLFYAACAILYGILGWLVVWVFTDWVIELTHWATAWGAGRSRLELLNAADAEGAASAGAWLINMWEGAVRAVATGFSYSYFWVAASAIYLLIRRDVDEHLPFDEVYMPDENESYSLPPLAQDEHGVADVDAEGEGTANTED